MKVKGYNPGKIEPKWRKEWEGKGIFSPDLERAKKPFYNLMMFPYPSAEGLHVGNMYAFTGADIYGRFMRMQGYDVFEPIGLDGFGIHSENYALSIGEHPAKVAQRTQKTFYRQLRATGNAYDWIRTLETYDPDYYKWTQWIFVQMFKRGLAYRARSQVNWCPSCKTVLADEQVIAGKCERCSSIVQLRSVEQWFFRITKYAEKLLKNLDWINWSKKVKVAQRNWIGKSDGSEIRFELAGPAALGGPAPGFPPASARHSPARVSGSLPPVSPPSGSRHSFAIPVFTTRPDTLFGATFLVLSPESDWVEKVTAKEHQQKVSKYIKTVTSKSSIVNRHEEKTGVFTGSYAINPATNEKIPIWVADYVVGAYGSGAIMGVPAHDERDFEFAKKYKLKVRKVIETERLVDSGEWTGWKTPQDLSRIISWLTRKKIGKRAVQYHLRDWLISRQRYWGSPIPMIYCEKCASEGKSWFTQNAGPASLHPAPTSSRQALAGARAGSPRASPAGWNADGWYPVPEDELPVKLPYIKNYRPTGTGLSPLAQDKSWVRVACPGCGKMARRETDVSDTFLDSSWYFFRYPSLEPKAGPAAREGPFDIEITKKWLPVEMYIGGAEHAVLHLMYARFITMVFNDWGLIDFEEPFERFYAHGLLIAEGAKMSKSRGNIVIPDEYIKKFGADTLRSYLMFLGPFDQGGDFRDTGIEGMYRFVKRVWDLVTNWGDVVLVETEDTREVLRAQHKTIKKVTEDLENLRYNTAISHIMEFVNLLREKTKGNIKRARGGIRCAQWDEAIKTLVLLSAPIVPHITEELWVNYLGEKFSIHQASWPKYSEELVAEEAITIAIQVNGKLRDTVVVPANNANKKEFVDQLARKSERVSRFIAGNKIKQTVFVPGKLVNFVTT